MRQLRRLQEGRLERSNNWAARSIEPFVRGRKNFLLANTPGGAKPGALIYSPTRPQRKTASIHTGTLHG
ncbi:MAG: transposase [Clostridia bacterium]